MIPVHENYLEYQPPKYVHTTIVKLLSKAPQQHLSGLESVVLTNAAAIGKGKTHRVAGRKHTRSECLGFYHPRRKGEKPWIEIVVDNVLAAHFGRGIWRFLARIPILRNFAFAGTLYHEVGHHLDGTVGPLAAGSEATADAWKYKLLSAYLRTQYPYLRPLVRLAYLAVRRKFRGPR